MRCQRTLLYVTQPFSHVLLYADACAVFSAYIYKQIIVRVGKYAKGELARTLSMKQRPKYEHFIYSSKDTSLKLHQTLYDLYNKSKHFM